MASSGPNAPGTTVDDSAVGTVAWTTPNNAQVSDAVYTTSALANNVVSHYLKATNYGFAIPAGATINGIVVENQRKSSVNLSTRFVRDITVSIVKSDGTIGSTNKADLVTKWPTTEGYATYGANNDLWGETWAYTDINDVDFGVAISAKGSTDAATPTASIDFVRITVYYTAAATSFATKTMLLGVGSS